RVTVHAVWAPAGSGRHSQSLAAAGAWGFRTHPTIRRATDLDGIRRYYGELQQRRDGIEVDIDGAVVKVDSLEQQERLGMLSRAPRWAIAYKFKPRQGTTRIKNVVASVGRLGTITPIAELEPVAVGGVTITSASLHNMDEIERKDV